MAIKTIVSVLSGLVFLYAFYPYIKAILRRQAIPRKATWLIWAAGDIIAIAGMITQGTISYQLAAAVLGASTVFVLSLKFGESGWTMHDKVCITIAVMAIVLWQYFGDSNIGIALSLLALAVAAWPTYVSVWCKPENEDRKAWILFELSSVLAVIAIPRWTFVDVAPPLVFLGIDSVVIYLLFVRPRYRVSVV